MFFMKNDNILSPAPCHHSASTLETPADQFTVISLLLPVGSLWVFLITNILPAFLSYSNRVFEFLKYSHSRAPLRGDSLKALQMVLGEAVGCCSDVGSLCSWCGSNPPLVDCMCHFNCKFERKKQQAEGNLNERDSYKLGDMLIDRLVFSNQSCPSLSIEADRLPPRHAALT